MTGQESGRNMASLVLFLFAIFSFKVWYSGTDNWTITNVARILEEVSTIPAVKDFNDLLNNEGSILDVETESLQQHSSEVASTSTVGLSSYSDPLRKPGGPLHHSPFRDSLFYIYELPEEFWWRWPHPGTEQSCKENGYLGHEHAELSAIGRPIRPDDGLFLTWHFSMFNSLYNRLKRSSRRTKDPSKASLFIIPYDLGLDGYMDPKTCANRKQCTWGLADKLVEILNTQPFFTRNKGSDHVLMWSLGQYHPWPGAGCDVFMKEACAKCTMTCYWMDPTKQDNRFISMPFPAAYHWWDGIKNIPWDLSLSNHRNLTVVYLGSTQTLNPYHTKIRKAMAAQCEAHSECHWLKLGHSSIDNSIGDLLSVYKKATFCLCPPGDDPARKAVFDAIVSGCIPVIFDVQTLYNQYPWHIGEQAALDISVSIPGGQVKNNKIDIMNVLLSISPDVIRRKQQALTQVAPRIQYAIPPIDLLKDKNDETIWDPPLMDAAEVALEGFFERASKMVRDEPSGIPHRFQSGRSWGQEYDVVKVKIPGEEVQFGRNVNLRTSTETVAESHKAATAAGLALTQPVKPSVAKENHDTINGVLSENPPRLADEYKEKRSHHTNPIGKDVKHHRAHHLGKSNGNHHGPRGKRVMDAPGEKENEEAHFEEEPTAVASTQSSLTFPAIPAVTNSDGSAPSSSYSDPLRKPGGPLHHSPFRDSLFYIYELPEEFWWRWPHPGTEQSCKENGYLGHEHAELSAIGRPIRPDDGLFLTWHFSMFNSLYNRLKRSSRRTKDPSKASLFIIPYDLGLDGYMNPSSCQNRKQCTHGLVGKLTTMLQKSEYFTRYDGGDHVLMWSLGQYHPWPRAGCDVFMRDTCGRCTMTCYWMDPAKVENRFISMPFPAAYHWWDGIKNVPWDLSRASQRNLTAVYLGSTQTLNPHHTKIRRAMAAQCEEHSDCHWMKISHSSIDNSIGDYLSIYKRSVFCLCPPGDDPARKAVFDAIVSGCIPVIFEVATLFNQYPWHIGEQAALDIAVHIPGMSIRNNKLNLMTILLSISPEVIRMKQQALAQVAPRIQYAIPPIERLKDKYDETTWDPPFMDAAEVALEGFFERTSKIIKNQSTGIPHRPMNNRDWWQEYEVVKVQVPAEEIKFGRDVNLKSSILSVAESQSRLKSLSRADRASATSKADHLDGTGVLGAPGEDENEQLVVK